jgi:carbonic anhydrase
VSQNHDEKSANHNASPGVSRRRFLSVAGAAVAGLAVSRPAFAKEPPKPQNVLSPDAALDRLVAGNGRYVQGVALRHDFKYEREALVGGQNPFAAILSCSDSRIAPEYAFDSARGDLFVVRVAGNFATDDGIASMEYAVSVLRTPLILVLGHQSCGAVSATISSIRDGTTLPGHLPSLVTGIAPAVRPVLDQPGNVLENATRRNVTLAVEKLKGAAPILDQYVSDGKVRVVGGLYRLDTGKVELLG